MKKIDILIEKYLGEGPEMLRPNPERSAEYAKILAKKKEAENLKKKEEKLKKEKEAHSKKYNK